MSDSIGATDVSTDVPARSVDTVAGRRHRCSSMTALTCGKLRQVGFAQHEPDVRIGDEKAVAVDDVRLALVADLDARHDVPDELQIDVGDGHRSPCRRRERIAIVMYGSVSLRKYTGPNHGVRASHRETRAPASGPCRS